MSRRALALTIVVTSLVIAAAFGVASWVARNRGGGDGAPAVLAARGADPAALARLRTIPLYRPLAASGAVREATLDDDGTLHVQLDLRAFAGRRLSALGFEGASGLLPASARGTIVIASPPGVTPAVLARESWALEGSAPLFDLLDRSPQADAGTRLTGALPGSPSAIVKMRLVPARLANPTLGGPALAGWRDRVEVVEKLLGRSIRAEFGEDLAGPAVFALYETAGSAEAEAIAAFALRRSDRLAGLLDTLFGLGALTERATVRRYRGVATGSFVPAGGGAGLALAVDGSILLVATSRARLESAIDALRFPGDRNATPAAGDAVASWSAHSTSNFVAHGWTRLARLADEPHREAATMAATIRPEGDDGWRLEGNGPSPVITADPLVPFLRSVFARRQGAGG